MALGKKPGLAVGIMIGKPKPGLGGLPSVEKKGQPPAQDPDQDQDQDQQAGSVGPEDVDYSDNDLCESCANMGEDGNCTKYGFSVQPTGHCEAGYMPKDGGQGGESEIDTTPDQSADQGESGGYGA